MARVFKATDPYEKTNRSDVSIFLGGAIDMGAAENWQEKITNDLSDYENILILNPRRDDWDSSWIQDPTPGTKFYEQVSWELEAQEFSDILIYYFTPDSKAPITLLELGLFSNNSTLVHCPKEFYRYGNVKMVCDRYNIKIYETYEDLLEQLKKEIGFNTP